MSPCAEQISRLLRDSLHPHGCEGSVLGDTGRAKAELGYKQEVSNGCQVWSWWEKKLFLNLQVDLIKVGVPVTTREVKGSNLENRLRLEQQLKREECVCVCVLIVQGSLQSLVVLGSLTSTQLQLRQVSLHLNPSVASATISQHQMVQVA